MTEPIKIKVSGVCVEGDRQRVERELKTALQSLIESVKIEWGGRAPNDGEVVVTIDAGHNVTTDQMEAIHNAIRKTIEYYGRIRFEATRPSIPDLEKRIGASL